MFHLLFCRSQSLDFSIPVGLLLGFLIAKCGFNWLVEQGNLVSTQTGSMGVQNQQVPLFSLPVILLCIFVSFLTVALALRKPMKIVSRISPIEATRYLENAETHKKGKRNGRKNVTVFSMAMANITGMNVLRSRAKPGDVLLFKGSHGMHMENILKAFMEEEK